MNATALPRPLWLITASVLVAHALVLQATPLGHSTPAPAPALVFSTRTIAAPVPMLAPLATLAPTTAPALASERARAPKPSQRTSPAPTAAAALFATTAPLPSQTDSAMLAPDATASEDTPHSPEPATAADTQPPSTEPPASNDGNNAIDANAAPQLVADASARRQRPRSNSAHDIPPTDSHAALANAPAHVPAPLRLEFDVTGQAKKFQYRASAELLWQHDAQHYQARQEIKVLFLGSRTQTSRGDISAHGLRPLHFSDQSRREQTAQFDYEQGLIRFNSDSPEAPLLPGTQDRLSVFIQLGALLAAAPERYPAGTRLQINTAGGRSANPWIFRVVGPETLELPVGTLSTLKLQRLPQDPNDNEQQAQLWLAPSLGYLPARIQLTQSNGDFADLRLNSHSKP